MEKENRNYEKENIWRKEKYKRYVLDLDKKIAERFSEKLKKDNKKYSEWAKECIRKYLEKN